MNETTLSGEKKNFDLPNLIFFRIPMALIGILILVGVTINFSNVVSRHLFQAAIFWAEEILVFIVVWSVFLGAIAVAYKGAHLKMDLVSARIGSPWREAINAITILAFIAGGIFAILQSTEVLELLAKNGQVSVTASVPMVVPHAAILVGFGLMVAAVIVRWRSYLKGDFE